MIASAARPAAANVHVPGLPKTESRKTTLSSRGLLALRLANAAC
jgi:hypothetical protein